LDCSTRRRMATTVPDLKNYTKINNTDWLPEKLRRVE
jgi:hypothetical protein